MRFTKGGLAVFVILILVLTFSTNARSEWWLGDGEEGILLDRLDFAPESPFHQMDKGIYGYYDEYQVFHIVIDLNVSNPIIPSTCTWKPGPMDFI